LLLVPKQVPAAAVPILLLVPHTLPSLAGVTIGFRCDPCDEPQFPLTQLSPVKDSERLTTVDRREGGPLSSGIP